MQSLASYKSATAAAAAMVLLLGSASVSAGAASDVADLVGARGSSGEMELDRRGYTNVTMRHGVQYWWNAERRACVGVKVSEGRYQSITAADASHCNQSAKAASSGSRQASSNAESACMVAVNNNYGGNVDDILVTSSEFSQANSTVMMKAGGEDWKCLVSNGGEVADLSVVTR